jgi:hypothetical protein
MQEVRENWKKERYCVSGKDDATEILGINPKTRKSKMQRLGIEGSSKNA